MLLVLLLVGFSSAAYDLAEAKQALFYSYSAYCPLDAIRSWSCFWCKKTAQPPKVVGTAYDPETNIFGYVVISQPIIWISFRGTQSDSAANWFMNLQANLVPFQANMSVKVHEGISNGWYAVKNQTLALFNQAKKACPQCRMIMTGHSLGAALSTLAFADMRPLLPAQSKLLTFGSPRIGNADWATLFKTGFESYRVTCKTDPISCLPPLWLSPSYHHIPREVWYPSNDLKDQRICDNSGEDRTCQWSIPTRYNSSDHGAFLGYNYSEGRPFGCGIRNDE